MKNVILLVIYYTINISYLIDLLHLQLHCSCALKHFNLLFNHSIILLPLFISATLFFIYKTNRTYQLCRENSHFGGQPHGLIEADREIEWWTLVLAWSSCWLKPTSLSDWKAISTATLNTAALGQKYSVIYVYTNGLQPGQCHICG